MTTGRPATFPATPGGASRGVGASSGSDPVNPVAVEQAIQDTANDIAKSVRGVSEALRDYRDKERAYDLAFARAYNRHNGPAHAKKYAAEERTQDERKARDDAEVVYRYAERRVKALEGTLSAYQSVMRSVVAMYQAPP